MNPESLKFWEEVSMVLVITGILILLTITAKRIYAAPASYNYEFSYFYEDKEGVQGLDTVSANFNQKINNPEFYAIFIKELKAKKELKSVILLSHVYLGSGPYVETSKDEK